MHMIDAVSYFKAYVNMRIFFLYRRPEDWESRAAGGFALGWVGRHSQYEEWVSQSSGQSRKNVSNYLNSTVLVLLMFDSMNVAAVLRMDANAD